MVWAIAQERTVGVKSRGVHFSDAQVKMNGVRMARLLGGGVVMDEAQRCAQGTEIIGRLTAAPLSWGLVHAARW
jgi:hypothetical protein